MMTRKQFIEKYTPAAVEITRGTGIFPLTLLSAAVVESQGKGKDGNWYVGNSQLAKEANNYFGIKAHKSWSGPIYNIRTREVSKGGKEYHENADFRKYGSFQESARDYVNFLRNNPRYTKHGVFTADTVQLQFQALKDAGYATDPNYVGLLSSVANGLKRYIPENPALSGMTIIMFGLGLFFLIKSN